MEVWPSDVGLRGQASNRPEVRWLKTVVLSVREKARKTCQVGSRKTNQSGWRGTAGRRRRRVVIRNSGIETEGPAKSLGMSLAGARVPARWCPAYRRREPGLLLLLGT
jgi:hypothetical protein